MKTAILGCGYIGTALLHFWKSERQHLIATTRDKARQHHLRPLAGDVRLVHGDDATALKALCCDAHRLIVCVAPQRGDSYRNTYLTTAQTLAATLPHSSIRHLIYTSATSVYGCHNGDWVSETSPLRPINERATLLVQTEDLYLSLASPSMHVTVLRLAGITGPGREIINRARALSGQECPGSGDQYCNLVDREDIVRAIDWALAKPLEGIYNVCNDDHPTRDQLYGTLTTKLHLPPIQWNAQLQSTHSGNKRVSTEKIRTTGFRFLHRCLPKDMETS